MDNLSFTESNILMPKTCTERGEMRWRIMYNIQVACLKWKTNTYPNIFSNVICPYFVKEIDKEMYGEWVYVLLQNHNISIITYDSANKGIAFDMR